jgi:hypothetical protein
LSINGIPTAESFGTPSVSSAGTTIAPQGIASQEAFGTTVLGLEIVVPGIDSEEAFGTPVMGKAIWPTGIASAESVGFPTLAGGAVTLSPVGIPSEESFGAVRVDMVLSVNGIASQESFGSVSVRYILFVNGVSSQEQLGIPALVQGSAPVAPLGIPSAEDVGTPILFQEQLLAPTGISSSENVGTPSLHFTLSVTGIDSEESCGQPTLTANTAIIRPTGIPSEEKFGLITVVNRQLIGVPGILSSEDFGTIVIEQEQFITVPGITTAEALGTIIVTNRVLTIMEQYHAEDIDNVLISDFAIPIVYTYRETGEQVQLQAIFDDEYSTIDPNTGAPIMSSIPNIVVATNKFIHKPQRGDHVDVRGKTYYVKTNEPDSTGTSVLTLEKT